MKCLLNLQKKWLYEAPCTSNVPSQVSNEDCSQIWVKVVNCWPNGWKQSLLQDKNIMITDRVKIIPVPNENDGQTDEDKKEQSTSQKGLNIYSSKKR